MASLPNSPHMLSSREPRALTCSCQLETCTSMSLSFQPLPGSGHSKVMRPMVCFHSMGPMLPELGAAAKPRNFVAKGLPTLPETASSASCGFSEGYWSSSAMRGSISCSSRCSNSPCMALLPVTASPTLASRLTSGSFSPSGSDRPSISAPCAATSRACASCRCAVCSKATKKVALAAAPLSPTACALPRMCRASFTEALRLPMSQNSRTTSLRHDSSSFHPELSAFNFTMRAFASCSASCREPDAAKGEAAIRMRARLQLFLFYFYLLTMASSVSRGEA
mmetsp:Transcript_54466/g.129821  ORF Transcript_54466/g.129821 Transcript_54466/m.129821 type:complete len:280 (+) Transcript_54466:491-1330(+)